MVAPTFMRISAHRETERGSDDLSRLKAEPTQPVYPDRLRLARRPGSRPGSIVTDLVEGWTRDADGQFIDWRSPQFYRNGVVNLLLPGETSMMAGTLRKRTAEYMKLTRRSMQRTNETSKKKVETVEPVPTVGNAQSEMW